MENVYMYDIQSKEKKTKNKQKKNKKSKNQKKTWCKEKDWN